MSRSRVAALTLLTMVAFAGNSLLCRAALKHARIDAASFTAVRFASGAATLWLITSLRGRRPAGSWAAAVGLFVYAAAFTYAYVGLPASTGALLLFGAVQATMIGAGIRRGERLHGLQIAGYLSAVGGLVALVLPGLSAPPLLGSALMLSAGAAWGIYSLYGKGVGDPIAANAGNFLRMLPMTAILSLTTIQHAMVDRQGLIYAVLSGAVTSGLGYAVWYTVLPELNATDAAAVQLSVPVIAAFGGVALLAEPISARLVVCSIAILGGIALVIANKPVAGRS
jgi:drug/metabolite transporter (DMT)-like permease